MRQLLHDRAHPPTRPTHGFLPYSKVGQGRRTAGIQRPSTPYAPLSALSFSSERRRESHVRYMQSPSSNGGKQVGASVSRPVRPRLGRYCHQAGHGRQVLLISPGHFTSHRVYAALVELCKGLGISSCSQLKSITFRLPAHVGFAGHDDAWLAAAACLHLIPPSAPLETLNVDIGSCFIMSGHVNPDAQKSILRYLDDAAHSLPFLRRVIIVAASDSACKVDDKMSNLFFSAVRSHLPKLQEKVELIIRDVV